MNNHYVKYKRARANTLKLKLETFYIYGYVLACAKTKKSIILHARFAVIRFTYEFLQNFNSKTVARVHTIHWDLVIAKTPYP